MYHVYKNGHEVGYISFHRGHLSDRAKLRGYVRDASGNIQLAVEQTDMWRVRTHMADGGKCIGTGATRKAALASAGYELR